MKIITSISQMQSTANALRAAGKSIGFVPTMGFFHAGHLSLMEAARQDGHTVVVSIFVNPIQFGPGEDFATYPRDLDNDSRLAKEAGVDILFVPQTSEMYPKQYQTSVVVKGLTETLCGRFRPGHFEGVTTVVAKLFSIVKPHVAYFGQKDFQQLVVIRRMVQDLNLDIQIKGLPTVREKDGLAMSSRNVYLSPEERQAALCLYRSICRARQMREEEGIREVRKIIADIQKIMSLEPLVKPQYIEICHPETLQALEYIEEAALLAMAVYVGKTRLIDNCFL
ncbi:MAG: pantoate--beta-alanine ligase [bacterium]|nr:pantoate--beta-alanine ligase [bacterium]